MIKKLVEEELVYTHRCSGLTGLSGGSSEALRTLKDKEVNRSIQKAFLLMHIYIHIYVCIYLRYSVIDLT